MINMLVLGSARKSRVEMYDCCSLGVILGRKLEPIYVLERKTSLLVFLSDPLSIDRPNRLGYGLCCIPISKKNWLFCWGEWQL